MGAEQELAKVVEDRNYPSRIITWADYVTEYERMSTARSRRGSWALIALFLITISGVAMALHPSAHVKRTPPTCAQPAAQKTVRPCEAGQVVYQDLSGAAPADLK